MTATNDLDVDLINDDGWTLNRLPFVVPQDGYTEQLAQLDADGKLFSVLDVAVDSNQGARVVFHSYDEDGQRRGSCRCNYVDGAGFHVKSLMGIETLKDTWPGPLDDDQAGFIPAIAWFAVAADLPVSAGWCRLPEFDWQSLAEDIGTSDKLSTLAWHAQSWGVDVVEEAFSGRLLFRRQATD